MTDFSYWLVPTEPLRTELLRLIGSLAQRFDATEFEPHVTIYSGPSSDQEVDRNLEVITNTFGSMLLSPWRLEFSQAFTKTLFIQFEPSSDLQAITDWINEHSETASYYRCNPHMSLLYQRLPTTILTELATTTTIPSGPYQFKTLQVIAADGPSQTVDDIRRWNYVQRVELTEEN